MFAENDTQIAFKTAIIKGLNKPESFDIFNIPVGHIYDLLVDNMDQEQYEYHHKGHDVLIMVTDDPDGISISLAGYFFLIDDSLEMKLGEIHYLKDDNLNNPTFRQAWADIIETIQALLDENDTKSHELCVKWCE